MNTRNTRVATFACVILGNLIMSCGNGKESQEAFRLSNTGISYIATARQRMPARFGGEENVFIQRIANGRKTPEYLIDHNGRFLNRLRVDSGNAGRWVRLYVELDNPMVGESVPFKTNAVGEISYVFRDHRTGQTVASNVYHLNVLAFVDFEAGVVISPVVRNSTLSERNSRLFGLVSSVPPSQELRGSQVVWVPTVRDRAQSGEE